jgi:hypothetical protein
MFEVFVHYRYAVPAGLDVCMPYHSIPTKTNDDDRTVSYSCDFGKINA